MPPWQGGGDMIRSVTFEKTTYNELPYKFEAGTPNIAGAIGLGAAHRLRGQPWAWSASPPTSASCSPTARPSSRPSPACASSAPPRDKAGVLSFVLEGVHPHDVGTILDREGVAVRAGHHCAQPVMERFGIAGHRPRLASPATTPATSVDALVAGPAPGAGDVRLMSASSATSTRR